MSDRRPKNRDVLTIGPDPTQLGGMAAVVGQILAVDWNNRWSVRLFPLTPPPNHKESIAGRAWRHFRHLARLRKTLRENPPAVVHIHTCSGFSFFRSAMDAWVAKRRGTKTILHIHGAKFDEFCRSASPIVKRILRFALQSADGVIALSEAWRTVIADVAPREKIAVIPNAVELAAPVDRANRNGPCRFLLLAKMDEWKGVEDLLLAAASVQDSGVPFELVLAGPAGSAGNEVSIPRRIAELDLSGRVVYVGPVQGERKAELLSWADVYVQPSHHEGLPIAVLEAMSYGLPVVATRVGALPEVIDEGVEGCLVSPGRPDQLSSAMTRLIRESRRVEMGLAGRRRVENQFSLGEFRDRLAGLYASLACPRNSEHPRELTIGRASDTSYTGALRPSAEVLG